MTLAEYTVGMTTKGFLRGLGSQVWAVPEDIHGKRYFLITAGTRFMAVYRAHAKELACPTGPDGQMATQLQAPHAQVDSSKTRFPFELVFIFLCG